MKNKYDTCRVEVGGSDSATLVLGLPANFGMKPILLNGANSKGLSTASASAKIETPAGGASIGKSEGSEGHEAQLSANEIRRRRQTERDCGLIDMDNGTYKTTVVVCNFIITHSVKQIFMENPEKFLQIRKG